MPLTAHYSDACTAMNKLIKVCTLLPLHSYSHNRCAREHRRLDCTLTSVYDGEIGHCIHLVGRHKVIGEQDMRRLSRTLSSFLKAAHSGWHDNHRPAGDTSNRVDGSQKILFLPAASH